MKQGIALFVIVFLVGFISVSLYFMARLRDARADMNTPEFQDKLDSVGLPPTRILSADGVELFRIASENRLPILDINDIPLKVRQAFLAAEDKRFYDHSGVDLQGLLRAASTLRDGRVSQGGSTLTMQLSKLLFTSSDRSFNRKVQDIAYAMALEESKTKDQILLLYLNKVYFGETAHGLKAASQVYFNKNFQDLTVGEAAMLARCVQLPSRFNPIKTPKRALENRDTVLGIMHTQHWLTDDEYKKALAEVPRVNPNPPVTTALRANFGQHFVQHVLDTLKDEAGDIDYKQGGYVIYTTLNSKLQKKAEAEVRKVVRDSRRQRVNQGAYVMMNRDGQILCEVGGTDFDRNEYNIITQGRRQPGSSFKAIVYSTAFATGELSGPNDFVSNAPISIPDGPGKFWTPQNASRRENARGYSARTAFAASVNRPAIHTLMDMGAETVVQYARDVFGIKSKLGPYPSLALGSSDVKPIEMLEAYSVFMEHGDRVVPQPIDRIVGTDGQIVKRFLPKRFTGVLSPQVCDMMDELTAAVVRPGGTARLAGVVPNAHGKTGTTNDAKDAWFCGYTDGLVGVAWVGNEQIINGTPHALPMASSVFGGTVAAKIWAGVMKDSYEEFHSNSPEQSPEDRDKRMASNRGTDNADDDRSIRVDISPDSDDAADSDVIPGADGDVEADPDVVPPTSDADKEAEAQRQQEAADKREADKQKELDRIQEQERERDREREKARDEARRRTAEPEMVKVEICADSHLLATAYCPETVTQVFPKGKAPKGRCRIHGG